MRAGIISTLIHLRRGPTPGPTRGCRAWEPAPGVELTPMPRCGFAWPQLGIAAGARVLVSSRRLHLEALERIRAPEHDKLVAAVNRCFRLGVELHAPVLTLDTDDDDAEPLAEARVDKRAIGEAWPRADQALLERQFA